FSPLTALFLSDNAPFVFPGFSLMIAFIQSVMIQSPPAPVPDSKLNDSVSVEA
nr:major facilitator superfamily [Tanacetum cinerariifolium]